MKKYAILLAVCVLALASCSKQQRTEHKLVKAMMSDDYETSFNAVDEFCEWVKADKSTMTHDFKYSKEKLGMKVNTSSDGKVRSYSWVTSQGDTVSSYANIIQWLVDDKMIGFSGPLDAMLTGRKPNIKRQWSLAHSIDTIMDIQEASQPIYMFVESYVNEQGRSFTYITAATIQGIRLVVLPFFFNGIETAGNREYIDDGKVDKSQLIKYDDKTKMLYSYLTDDNLRVIPGKYEQYALSKTQFVKVEQKQDNNTN